MTDLAMVLQDRGNILGKRHLLLRDGGRGHCEDRACKHQRYDRRLHRYKPPEDVAEFSGNVNTRVFWKELSDGDRILNFSQTEFGLRPSIPLGITARRNQRRPGAGIVPPPSARPNSPTTVWHSRRSRFRPGV